MMVKIKNAHHQGTIWAISNPRPHSRMPARPATAPRAWMSTAIMGCLRHTTT